MRSGLLLILVVAKRPIIFLWLEITNSLKTLIGRCTILRRFSEEYRARHIQRDFDSDFRYCSCRWDGVLHITMREMCTSLLIAITFYGKITAASISAEGAACAAMAIAMPQLTRLTGEFQILLAVHLSSTTN